MKLKILVLAIVVSVGCNEWPVEPGLEIQVQKVLHAPYTGVEQPRQEVILTQQRLDEIWREVSAAGYVRESTPQIDFRQSLVLFAARGIVGHAGCSDLAIDRAFVSGQRLIVEVQKIDWVRCPCLPVVGTPVFIVAIPRVTLDVDFMETRTEKSCPPPS